MSTTQQPALELTVTQIAAAEVRRFIEAEEIGRASCRERVLDHV